MLRVTHTCLLLMLLLVALAPYAGCSPDGCPRGVHASGVVLHNGVPLEGADVAFSSEGGERAAFARTDAEGRFTLAALDTQDGITPGSYRVRISKTTAEFEDDPYADPAGPAPTLTETRQIPDHYGSYDTSGLTAVVREDGPNEFRFELTD